MDSLVWLVILMGSYTMAAGLSSMVKIDSQREKACNPRMGNIALGRSVWTETTCGYNSTEVYCTYRENPEQICTEPKCDKCNSALPRLSHPPSAMGDSTFKIPRTWWQSARGIQTEIIRLDLETEFYFTHLIMVFKSPRPAAMILERSQDFGATWRPYKFFATNCSETFALEDDVTEKGALCTSRYSQAFPCSGGEVIYRAMSPPYSAEDPYSEEAQDQLKITNLRVQLLKQQICPCQSKDPEIKPQYLAHYAVYDFIVKGSCFCNGHADHCVPVDGFQQTRTTSKLQVISLACCYAIRVWNGNPGRPIISGIGTLTENICGWVENTLKPLVKQTPSFLQDTTDLLNKLADLGPIPESTILATMDVESLYTNIPHTDGIAACQGYRTQKDRKVHGRCLCKHNTVGAHCELCAPLYNDQPWQAANGNTGASNTCKKCKCNGHANSCHFDLDLWLASGNRSGGVCDNCQHNTEGHHCQRCKPGFFRDLNIPFSKPDACKACSCHAVGSAVLPYSSNAICDPSNGDCPCKPGVAGPHCDRCMVGYWGFGEYGCRPCDCARSCDPLTGDCITMDIDWHRDIPHLLPVYNDSGRSWDWEDEQGFSALRYPGKCECKEQVLGNPKVFCGMKYSYVLKTKILSAHDRGSHAEVNVKIKKVLKMTKLKIVRGKRTLYPESWTSRGCTCPILNPGLEYLVAGYEDLRTGRLIVNMKSFVQLWKPSLGKKVVEILKQDCK